MNQTPMTQRRKPVTEPPKQSRETDAAFDIWLTQGLHKLFDDVAQEPIPDALLKLILEDKSK